MSMQLGREFRKVKVSNHAFCHKLYAVNKCDAERQLPAIHGALTLAFSKLSEEKAMHAFMPSSMLTDSRGPLHSYGSC